MHLFIKKALDPCWDPPAGGQSGSGHSDRTPPKSTLAGSGTVGVLARMKYITLDEEREKGGGDKKKGSLNELT